VKVGFRRRKPAAFMPQACLAPQEIPGFGIGEEDPAIPVKRRRRTLQPWPPRGRVQTLVRLDQARNQDEGGTGFGLAIALDTARSHRGDITLATGRPGVYGHGAGAGVASSSFRSVASKTRKRLGQPVFLLPL